MTYLLSLPAEILQDIIAELPTSSILSFCQTYKAPLDFAEGLLYRSISLRFSKLLPEHPIHSFIRAIPRRPALASYIKTAEFLSGIDA